MSSLIFLGFSFIGFIVSYGLLWYLVPMILGILFSLDIPIEDPLWKATNTETQTVLRWLIPIAPSIGIFVAILKMLMVATARGRD